MTLALLLGALLGAPAHAAPPDRRAERDARLAAAAERLLPTVSRLRELEATHPVPVSVQRPRQLRAELVADGRDAREVDDLEKTVATLKAFGLLPKGTRLKRVISDVLTAHIGGFYDPETLRLVLVRRDDAFADADLAEGSEDAMVVAHELVHALQDQRFDLWRLTNRDYASDDVGLALHALVEGDASWAMLRFTAGDLGGLGDGVDDATFSMIVHTMAAAPPSAEMAKLPGVLRDVLLFPYLDGLAFARAVQRVRGWAGVDAAYARPPLSSEHVLHPQKYLDGADPPLRLDLPELAPQLGAGWRTVDENGLGELGVRSMLVQLGLPEPKAVTAARGWGGDTYVVLERRGELAAVWATAWDTEEDAIQWAHALSEQGWRVAHDGLRALALRGVPDHAIAAVCGAVSAVTPTPITSLDEVSTPRPEPRRVDEAHARGSTVR